MSPATRWMYALLAAFVVAAAMMFTNGASPRSVDTLSARP